MRLLGVAAVKYLVLGLVFLNYQSAFRAVNSMFNGVADGIYNLSGGMDVIKAWGNSLSQAWSSKPQLVFCSLELGDRRYISHRRWPDNAGRLLNPPLPGPTPCSPCFTHCTDLILYVVGPFVLALIPSRGLGQLGRTYFVNMMVFQCWGLLYAILQALMTALQITNPMQFN